MISNWGHFEVLDAQLGASGEVKCPDLGVLGCSSKGETDQPDMAGGIRVGRMPLGSRASAPTGVRSGDVDWVDTDNLRSSG